MQSHTSTTYKDAIVNVVMGIEINMKEIERKQEKMLLNMETRIRGRRRREKELL